jgi:hypothetical protein
MAQVLEGGAEDQRVELKLTAVANAELPPHPAQLDAGREAS